MIYSISHRLQRRKHTEQEHQSFWRELEANCCQKHPCLAEVFVEEWEKGFEDGTNEKRKA